jgi:8-oxo-dGTP pyrophosphatase MutT (NUDIX family)
LVRRPQPQLQPIERLADLVTPEIPRASSLLLSDEGRFLLGIRPPIHERGRVLLRLTGIGGWAEGDESFSATALREASEETGSGVRLLDLDQTLLVRSPADIQPVPITHDIAPAAVVYRRFGTAPFDPWSDTHGLVAPVAVYVGILRQPARIQKPDELPLFMWVYPEQMIALADADEPLDFLLADGAELVGPVELDTSRAIVRLTDSIQALLTALGARAFTFLCDIARLTQPARVE